METNRDDQKLDLVTIIDISTNLKEKILKKLKEKYIVLMSEQMGKFFKYGNYEKKEPNENSGTKNTITEMHNSLAGRLTMIEDS